MKIKKYRELKLENIATNYAFINLGYKRLMEDAPYRGYLIKGKTL